MEVEGRIGDQSHLKFILDTGASTSIVGARIARKMKLDARTAQSFDFDRMLQWKTATVTEIQFGPIRAANVVVLVGDLARYSDLAGAADAMIGMDLLQLSNFTIDFASKRLLFDPGPPRAYVPRGDPMAKCLILELQIQNRPVRLVVDSGSQGLLLYEERLRRRVPGLRTSGSMKNMSLGGRVHAKQVTLPEVMLGKRAREVSVLLLPSPGDDVLPGVDGILGITALQAQRLYVDFSTRTLSWE